MFGLADTGEKKNFLILASYVYFCRICIRILIGVNTKTSLLKKTVKLCEDFNFNVADYKCV